MLQKAKDIFEGFEEIINKKEIISEHKKTIEKFTNKRLGRATGSNYDKIKFTEEKKLNGKTPTRKDDIIAWILSRSEGKALIDAEILKAEKESANQLKNDVLKQIMDNISGDLILGEQGYSYMYSILAQLMTGQFSEQTRSRSLDWGIEQEPFALNAYKMQELEKDPNLIFIENRFIINKYNKIVGCTPDLEVFKCEVPVKEFIEQFSCSFDDMNTVHSRYLNESDIKKILNSGALKIRNVVENKCPWISANHVKTLDKMEVDERYTRQVFGHIYNSGSDCLWCDFTSYDPRMKKESDKLVTIRVNREDVSEELEQLETDLYHFAIIYTEKAKKLGINLKTILK